MQQLEEDKRNFELIMQRTVDEERTKREKPLKHEQARNFNPGS